MQPGSSIESMVGATSHTKESLETRVREFAAVQPWIHNIELPHGVRTRVDSDDERHSRSLGKWRRLEPHLSAAGVAGKRVLDFGCGDGFFSLKCNEMGAKEVVGVDINQHRIEKARFVQEILGRPNVRFVQNSLYDAEVKDLGEFDIVLCLGLVHRVPDPLAALKTLAGLGTSILVEWRAFEDPRRRSLLLYTKRDNEADPDITGYFYPTVEWVQAILGELGFAHQFVDDDSPWGRSVVIASQIEGPLYHQPDVRRQVNRRRLLRAYTRRYLSEVRDVLRGRITV